MMMTRALETWPAGDKKERIGMLSIRKRRLRKDKAVSKYIKKICLKKERLTCFVWIGQKYKLVIAIRKIQVMD